MFQFWKKKNPELLPSLAPPSATPNIMANFMFDTALLSDIGCTRKVNQDYGVIVRPASESPKGVLVAVADGMGGHKGGEVASRRAIQVISRVYYETPGDPYAGLKQAFEEANFEIFNQAQESDEYHGMGTTCVTLALAGGAAYAAHVGDSRLYLARGGELHRMTEDHSAVMELVKQGVLTLEESRLHPEKNVITRAIGSKPRVEVTQWNEPLPLKPGDNFLLCTDGLYDRIEDRELLEILGSRGSAESCEALINLAKERGGLDNVTAAVVRVQL